LIFTHLAIVISPIRIDTYLRTYLLTYSLIEMYRLRKAVDVGSEAAVTKAVCQENLLLQTYGIVLSPAYKPIKPCPQLIPGMHDVMATRLPGMFLPDLLHRPTHVILQVAGDGNCLFRAISQAQYGTEDYYELLHLKTGFTCSC